MTNTTLNTLALPTATAELTENNVAIYPNPATDQVTVRLDNNFPATIVIRDLLGKEVGMLRTNKLETEVDVAALENGIYFLTVEQRGNSISKKVVICR